MDDKNDLDRLADKSLGEMWLLESPRSPYYIVAPRYIRTSAGVKVLHLLCHALNRAGERAYLILHPYYFSDYATNPAYQTPLLTQRIIDHDFSQGLTPIVVYPEIVMGNPFDAPFVVRYVLNFPGLLGGDFQHEDKELIVTYSKELARGFPCDVETLFIPVSDPTIFSPGESCERSGTCFYAGKYKYFHGGELSPVTKDSIEITRDRIDSQSLSEIIEIFRTSEIFYCYENTALAIEAVLCGCPVVFIPNKYFTKVIGIEEHGWHGMAWGLDPDDIMRAKRTVSRARAVYMEMYSQFKVQLEKFIAVSQKNVSHVNYSNALRVPYLKYPRKITLVASSWRIISSIVHERGWLGAWRVVSSRIRRKGIDFLP